MKNIFRVSIFICFIFICIFSIININNVYAKDELIKLVNISISEKSDDIEAEIASFDKKNIKTNTVFHKLNDYVVYKLTIKNDANKDYIIKSIVNNNTGNNILYEYESYENEIISSKGTKDIYIKVIYKNELTDMSKRNNNDEVKLIFNLVDKEGNVYTTDIKVNPSTYDNVSIYITIGIISLVAIILLVVAKKKNSKKLMMMFVVILSMPVFVKALNGGFTITFNSTNKIHDKLIVTYDDKEEIIDYNTIIDRPNDPIKEGYEFVGWYVGENEYDFNTIVKDDIKIEAKWKAIEYTISYEDSNASNPTKYTIEDEITLVNPTKNGYSFSGWTGSNGNSYQTRVTIEKGSTGNKSFKANFSPNQNTSYKVIHRYANLNGTYEEVIENLTGTTDTNVTPALLSKTGFKGPDELETITISAEEVKTVIYTYSRIEYRLILNSDIDTTFTNSTYPYETEITLTAKDKENYEFTGWSNGQTTKTIKFNITDDTEIYPIYSRIKYTITYDAGDGTLNNISQLVDAGDSITSLPTPVAPVGKEFDGWYINETDEEKVNSDYIPSSSITLHARYNTLSYTVTFNTDGGSNVSSQTIEYGQKVTRPADNPTKENYVFVNWYTDDNYNTLFDFDNTIITSTTEIYAYFIDPCKTFSTDSWATIKANVISQEDYYGLGCTKTVSIDANSDGTPETYTLKVVNNSTPEQCLGEDFSQTACGFVLEFVEPLVSYNMNPTATNAGGWRDSALRTYLNEEIFNTFPEDLKSVIVPTKVLSGYPVDESEFYETNDNLYLISVVELWGSALHDSLGTRYTRQLDYYKSLNVSLSNPSGAIKYENGHIAHWWTRSAYNANNAPGFSKGTDNGRPNYVNSTANLPSYPIFRIVNKQ